MEKTARVFLFDLQTPQIWMRRIDEHGERDLIQTIGPVNRYPDFVRNLVRQLKVLFPAIGAVRMAQVLARAGLHLSATTIHRVIREKEPPNEDPEEPRATRRRCVVARYPGHTFHVDLTTVPTRAGFWVPWFPYSLPQSWPFCWWVAVAIDQVSPRLIGFAVFSKPPTSLEVRRFLQRAIRVSGRTPKYIVTDKGTQFWCRGFKSWCKRRGIRPRYGAIGQPASIAIVERFIRSLKQECTRCILVPVSLSAMRRDVGSYARWYNHHRPHSALAGKTPCEVYGNRTIRRRRLETRSKWPTRSGRRRRRVDRFRLAVRYVDRKRHLPVVELRRAA